MKMFVAVACVCCLPFTTGCLLLSFGIEGSGVSATEDREVDDFSMIKLAGQGTVNIIVGEKESLVVTGDDNLLEYIDTSVSDGELIIRTTESLDPKVKLQFDVTVPELSEIRLSGAGDINVARVEGESLSIDVSGAGDINAVGKVDKVDLSISGAGKANLRELIAGTAEVSISGAASAVVYASEMLDASVSGAGKVTCYGNPADVDRSVSGIGKIRIVKEDE